jgi:hypothetical protein
MSSTTCTGCSSGFNKINAATPAIIINITTAKIRLLFDEPDLTVGSDECSDIHTPFKNKQKDEN